VYIKYTSDNNVKQNKVKRLYSPLSRASKQFREVILSYNGEENRKKVDNDKHVGHITSLLIGSPSQWMTVSGATMQYGEGSVSTTLNSTARIPPRTMKASSL
jgi:hypothetical protein